MSDNNSNTPIRTADFRRWEREHGEDFFDQFSIVNEKFLLGFLLSTDTAYFDRIKGLFLEEGMEIAGVRNELVAEGIEEAETDLLDAIAAICNLSPLHEARVREAFTETNFVQS